MQDRDVFVLESIVKYCDKIMADVVAHSGEKNEFYNDEDYQELCAFRLIQIGKNANSLSETFKDAHPEIPWHRIVAARNILTHDYGEVNIEVIWETITDDVPSLRRFCAEQIGKD